ncbi:MAG: CHAT domain-containing protein, partial [Gemmatimonadales bacterium]
MDYRDFELKVRSLGGKEYEIDVRSPSGEKTSTVRFPFDELALESRLQALEIALLRASGTRRDIRFKEEESVEDFGKALFDMMLGGEIRDLYRRSRQAAVEEGRGLRLRLRVEAPELASLPWEYMFDEGEGDFVCLSAETPVIRYMALDRPPPPLSIEPPIRVLGMVASPKDRATLDVEREIQRIDRATQRLRDEGLLHWEWLPGGGWRDLQRAMRGGPWHVFHFVGHGGFDPSTQEGLLAMVDERGESFRISATQLGRLLADHHTLRLAVLNSCEGAKGSDTNIFSSTSSILMRRGVPAVVAMQYEITDRAAIEFSQVFYEDIARGLAVDTAVTEARKAISMSLGKSLEWGTPVLYMRAPDGVLFDIQGKPTPPVERPGTPPLSAGAPTPAPAMAASTRGAGAGGSAPPQSPPPPTAP